MRLLDKFQVQAPTRADLAGGTLDLWPLYCLVGDSRTINVALDLFASAHFEAYESPTCKVEVSGNGKSFLFYEPVKGADLEKVPAPVRFPTFVVGQFLSAFKTLPKVHLKMAISTQAPQGSGLGGSSALCVAMARGLGRLGGSFQEQGWQWKLLDWVKDVEAAFLKIPTGTQDYLASLFGGLQSYSYSLGNISNEPYSSKAFQELNERLVVFFSGEQHYSGISNWELFKKAMEGNKDILTGLSGIRDVSGEMHVELKKPEISWAAVGKWMDEEWRIRRQVFQVNTPTLDKLVSEIRRPGVLGVKVCGAAQGGSLIALVEPQQRANLLQTLKKEGISCLSTSAAKSPVQVLDLHHSDTD